MSPPVVALTRDALCRDNEHKHFKLRAPPTHKNAPGQAAARTAVRVMRTECLPKDFRIRWKLTNKLLCLLWA